MCAHLNRRIAFGSFTFFVFFAGFKVAAISQIREHLESGDCAVVAVESFFGGLQITHQSHGQRNGLEMIDVVNVI